MARSTSIVLAVLIWGLSFVPALLVMLWLGLIEPRWTSIALAVLALALIAFTFELFQAWVGRRIKNFRAGPNGVKR
jgi:hypothetical protein